MLPTAHLFLSLIFWKIMSIYFNADTISLLLVIMFGVLIDGDAVLLGSSHRDSPIHSIIPWGFLIPTLYLLDISYFWTPIAALLHLFLDALDWGIYAFYPLSKRIYGPRVLTRKTTLNPKSDTIISFVREYISSAFLYGEILLAFMTITIFLFL